VAMHIASANPLALVEADIPADRVEREKAVLLEQLKEDPKAQGKPQQVLDKMIEGRMRKFFEESVLTKQAFVLNPDQTVEAAIADAAKAAGAPVSVKGFVRFAVGEGVEKKKDDFAAEVAAMSMPSYSANIGWRMGVDRGSAPFCCAGTWQTWADLAPRPGL